MSIRQNLGELVRFRHLIVYIARTALTVESRGTKLGRMWWVIEPLLLMGVYTVLVRVILHRGGQNYALVVLVAILAWEFFVRSTQRSMGLLLTTARSMPHVAFPRAVIPLAVTLAETVRFVIALGAFIVIGMAFGVVPTPMAVLAVPFVLVEVLFTLGMAYLLSATNIFFRDTKNISEYLFWLLFHLAPGLYTLAMVPVKYRPLFAFNPLTTFFEGLRAPLLYGRAPDLSFVQAGSVVLLSILLLVGGYVYFLRREGTFAKVVVR